MIQNTRKYGFLNLIHRVEDRKTMYMIGVIATVLLVFGYIVGQASGLNSYAQGSTPNAITGQATGQQTSGANRGGNSQQFSATNAAQSSENSTLTTLLTLGAVTFATLGAVKVYKVMTS